MNAAVVIAPLCKLATKFRNSEQCWQASYKVHVWVQLSTLWQHPTYIQLHLETRQWSLPEIRLSHCTSCQCPVVLRRLLRSGRPRTISYFIGLNLWRLSSSRRGGWSKRSVCIVCFQRILGCKLVTITMNDTSLYSVSCVLSPSWLSCHYQPLFLYTEHVDNLFAFCAQTLCAMCNGTLQHHGLQTNTLHAIFQATRSLSYASPTWWGTPMQMTRPDSSRSYVVLRSSYSV